MSRLTEKQLLFLTIGIALLLTGGLGFLIWSDLQAISEEEAKISDLEQQIEAANREIEQIPAREFRVIANREISDREVAFLPEEDEIEVFWEVLERFASESGVRISEIAPTETRSTGNRRGQKQGPIASVPQLLSLRATTEEFLRFINLLENHDRIINVMEYSLTSGDVADEDGKIRHSIRLALTTFTYSKTIANTIVSIPKYEEKRNHPEVKKWLSRIKIQEKETYTLTAPFQRRDPFVSIRRPQRPDVNPDHQDEQKQNAIVDNLVELVRALAAGLDYEEELQKRGDLWRLQLVRRDNRDTYAQLAQLIADAEKEITIRAIQERFQKEVSTPWEEIKKRMAQIVESNPPMALPHVQERLDKVQAFFDEKKWDQVQREVRDFLDASRNGEHVVEAARPLVLQITELARSAKVIENFEKLKIVISTILYSPNGLSVAVINGRQMSEGDALDAQGTVIVVEIGENYVIFETEGVEIKKLHR